MWYLAGNGRQVGVFLGAEVMMVALSLVDDAAGAIGAVTVWVLGCDANGAPALTKWSIGATRDEQSLGVHYERAIELAEEAGYDGQMIAFDERDPAGRHMVALMGMQSTASQQSIRGNGSEPLWDVRITVDATLSATVRVHAASKAAAVTAAREFAATEEGWGLMSLDEGNYRGAGDYYCGDVENDARLATEAEVA